jgi:tetratricopeptide (TPR) repeat protein
MSRFWQNSRVKPWLIAGVCVLLYGAGAKFFPDRSSARKVKDLEHFPGTLVQSTGSRDRELNKLYASASAALERGDAPAAEAIYRQIIVKYPRDPDGFRALGTTLLYQKKLDAAEVEYRRALELDPNSVRTWHCLGCVEYDRGRRQESLGYLQKALDLDEKFAPAHRTLGYLLVAMGDRTKARSHLERALALEPSYANEEKFTKKLKEATP